MQQPASSSLDGAYEPHGSILQEGTDAQKVGA